MIIQKEVSVRIDKWLWCVRLFKSRSAATDACRAGKVKINGRTVKAAYEVSIGDVCTIHTGQLDRVIRVKEILSGRVSAKLVADFLEDLTPKEELLKLDERRRMKQGIRPYGFGRPTKKERRDLENFTDF